QGVHQPRGGSTATHPGLERRDGLADLAEQPLVAAGPAEDRAVEVLAIAGDVVAAEEGTHRVPEQEERQPGVLRTRGVPDGLDVLDRRVPAVVVGVDTAIRRAARGLAVATVVVRPHRVPGIGERLREALVSA